MHYELRNLKNINLSIKQKTYSLSALFLTILLIGFQGCSKEEAKNENRDDHIARYVTPPLFTAPNLDFINDQKRYISLGLCELLNNLTMASLPESYENVESYLDISLSNDIMPIKSLVFKTNNAYLIPTVSANNEFGDAINYAVNASNVQNAAIYNINNNLWEWDMLERCLLLNKTWHSYIQIPDYQSLTNADKLKPVCIVPIITDANDDAVFPITAYIWDFVNGQVAPHPISDYDEINNNPDFYVWCVNYEPSPDYPRQNPVRCSGDDAPVCGDNDCDAACGETPLNCSDCSPDKNKKLRIKKYALTMDHRVRTFCKQTGQSKERHLRKIGNFHLAYGSLVDKPSGKFFKSVGIFEKNPLKRSHAHLESTTMWPGCNFVQNNGGATWSEDYPIRTYLEAGGGTITTSGEAVLDYHFNPKLASVMIMFYHDDARGDQQTVTVNIPGKSETLSYTSKHSLLGGWHPTTNQKYVSTSYILHPYTTPAAQLQLITPDMWQTWSSNPIVPASDEIQILSPNGDFLYVIEYVNN